MALVPVIIGLGLLAARSRTEDTVAAVLPPSKGRREATAAGRAAMIERRRSDPFWSASERLPLDFNASLGWILPIGAGVLVIAGGLILEHGTWADTAQDLTCGAGAIGYGVWRGLQARDSSE